MTGCGGSAGGGGEVVAVVNGERITKAQYYDFMEVKPEVQVRLQNGQVANAAVADTIGFQSLQDLIRQRVIVQLAKDQKLEPSPSEVDAELQFQKSRDSNFVTALLKKGLTLDQIRDSLHIDLSREKLLTAGITITDSDVTTYISKNKQQFTIPALFDAKWIFVKDDAKKRQVERSLNTGDSFPTIARRFSDDPDAKANNGQFANRNLDALPPAIKGEIQKVALGEKTKWIKLEDGWALFLVESRTPSKYKEPDKTERTWIKRQLAIQKGIQTNDLDRRLLKKLQESKIDVTYQELKDPWGVAWQKIKDADPNKAPDAEGKTEGTDTGIAQ